MEYLEKYNKAQDDTGTLEGMTVLIPSVMTIDSRRDLVRQYSWAVPNDEALDTLAKYQPLVEIGAGTGYWAYELRERGIEIAAYDKSPPDGTDWQGKGIKEFLSEDKNWYHRGYTTWTEVRQGDPNILKTFPPIWNLFLCWPPMSDMAAYALGYHRGQYICYIGEPEGGCTGDKLFFRLLNRLYDEVESVDIPQWYGLHDYLTIYKRKNWNES